MIKVFFKKLQNVLLVILNILYPYKCISCRNLVENNKTFCVSCWRKIQFIRKPCCKICSEPFQYDFINNDDELICANCIKHKPKYDRAIACFIYNKTIAKAIFEFKFFRKTFLKYFFVDYIEKATKEVIDEVDFLIPVPLDRKRLQWRGFNQSLLLAEELGKRTNKKVIPDLLIKTKHTLPQAKLNNINRRKNLKSVFMINNKYLDIIKNKNIAILDDVMTTGTTTSECSKILKHNKVNKVFVFTIAKTSLLRKENNEN